MFSERNVDPGTCLTNKTILSVVTTADFDFWFCFNFLIFRFLKKRNNRYIPFKNKNKKQIGYSLNNIPDSRSP